MQNKFGTLMYQGEIRDIYVDEKQASDLRYSRGKFFISKDISKNIDRVNQVYNDFCKDRLDSIISSGISRLRDRKIPVTLSYTDGTNVFDKQVEMSVNDYLRATDYSQHIRYKIGHYTSEWGINQIDPKNKEFILHFNQDLIKYDSGSKIDYVVAHELTHVFHRDHGPLFNDALEKLYPKKWEAENYFNKGIGNLFKVGGGYTSIILFTSAVILLYLGWNAFIQFLGSLNIPWIQVPTSSPTPNQTLNF